MIRRARLAPVLLLALAACPQTQGATTCRKHEECTVTGSYCARAEVCTLACDDGGTCPSGSACVTWPSRSVCLEVCAADADCAKGFACHELSGGRACELVDPLAQPPP